MKPLLSVTDHSRTVQPSAGRLGHQSGIALIVALLALVAITLATIALVRSAGTGLEIAGNMAFRESATTAADVATDVAVSWLVKNAASNPAVVNTSAAANGYYANWMSGCDFTGNRTPTDNSDNVGWTGSGGAYCTDPLHAGVPAGQAVNVSTGMPAGYTASYIVTRMCFCDGPSTGYCPSSTTITNSCVGIASAGRFHETATYDNRGLSGEESGRVAAGVSPYYRVVTRVAGPRNTVSFVETMVTLDY
jgi:type IV pilus assembly protein PilX